MTRDIKDRKKQDKQNQIKTSINYDLNSLSMLFLKKKILNQKNRIASDKNQT